MTEDEEEQIIREHEEQIAQGRRSWGRLAWLFIIGGCILSCIFMYVALKLVGVKSYIPKTHPPTRN